MPSLKLSFNLQEILKETEKSKAKRRALSPFIKQDQIKREFGRRAIDAIQERTLAGRDKRNRPMKKYSKAYKESFVFKLHGKKDKPNLKLTGEMQAAMNVLKTTVSGVTIGIPEGEQEQKARGHINGSGHLPVRDFWGLSKADQNKILKSVIRDFNLREGATQLLDAIESLAIGVQTERGDDLVQDIVIGGNDGDT